MALFRSLASLSARSSSHFRSSGARGDFFYRPANRRARDFDAYGISSLLALLDRGKWRENGQLTTCEQYSAHHKMTG
jgi:hypothetical protein